MAAQGIEHKGVDGISGTVIKDQVLDIGGYPFVSAIVTADGAAASTVQVSNDKTVWVTLKTVTAGTTDTIAGTYPYRYIKVTSTGAVTAAAILASRSGK